MTPKINSKRICSNCSRNKTYIQNNTPHWYHSKITGQIICKLCYNNDRYDSKPKITDGFQNNFIRTTSYTESESGRMRKRKITWE